jgi:hypothetical protein
MKFALIVLMLVIALPAHAEDKLPKDGKDSVRLIDFNALLKLPDGDPITECTKDDGPNTRCTERKPVTLGLIAYRALQRAKPSASLNEAASRWRLSRKVQGAVQLSSADVTTVITAIHEFSFDPQKTGGGFTTEIEGQALCMLDPTYCEDK